MDDIIHYFCQYKLKNSAEMEKFLEKHNLQNQQNRK